MKPVLAGLARAGGRPEHAGLAGRPADLHGVVQGAAQTCTCLPWGVLAGIGKVESDDGRSTLPVVHSGASYAGAEGPMQFEPATFAQYAADQ